MFVAFTVTWTVSFPGSWTGAGPDFRVFEVLAYSARATDSSTHFSIVGAQVQQVTGGAPNKAVMFYTGNWWDWQLQLVVPDGYVPF